MASEPVLDLRVRALRSAAGVLLSAALLAACAPVHRAKRDAEPTSAATNGATSAAAAERAAGTDRATPALVPATKTATAALPPAKPKVKWAPARVEAKELRAARARGDTPRVTHDLARQYGAKRSRILFDVCVTPEGTVDAEHSVQLDGPFDAGLIVKQTVQDWRFQPRAATTCATFTFVVHPDGYCREDG